MNKFIIFGVVFAFSAVVLTSVFAGESPLGAAKKAETPLSCQVLKVVLQWAINHPGDFHKTVDFDGNGKINLGDLIVFAQKGRNDNWCSERLNLGEFRNATK